MKLRINIDRQFYWTDIKTNGMLQSLLGRDIKLQVIDPNHRKSFIDIDIRQDTVVSFKWFGIDQKYLGTYSLTLWENYGKHDQAALDKTHVLTLVATTEEEDIPQENNIVQDSVIQLEGGEFFVGIKGDNGGFYYPTFHIDENMHLQMDTDAPASDKFSINKNGHLNLTM